MGPSSCFRSSQRICSKRALGYERTDLAQGSSWCTDLHCEIKDSVIVITEYSLRGEAVCEFKEPLFAPRIALVRTTQHASQPAEDVGVDDDSPFIAVKRNPGGSRIGADAGDGKKLFLGGRNATLKEPRQVD